MYTILQPYHKVSLYDTTARHAEALPQYAYNNLLLQELRMPAAN